MSFLVPTPESRTLTEPSSFDARRAYRHTRELCYPRRVGTRGERRAARYIAREFASLGLRCTRERFAVSQFPAEVGSRVVFAGCVLLDFGGGTTDVGIFLNGSLSYSQSIPNTVNRITIQDLTSFIAPIRRINTNPGDPGGVYNVRWDISPGAGLFSKAINIQDLTALITTAPPMFNNQRAFNYPTACTP